MRCYVDMLLITSTANIKTWERDNGLYGGLSPLVRGTLRDPLANVHIDRFIPAGAGNSQNLSILILVAPVYPRCRGELLLQFCLLIYPSGLSPLARGTPDTVHRFISIIRFIPADVGNSSTVSTFDEWPTVYPRWRGELSFAASGTKLIAGLSPLTWGTHSANRRSNRRSRFIPADVGNSSIIFCCCFVTSVYPRWRGELSKHNLLLINDFLSQSQSTNFTVSHKQHIHYVKEYLIHWLKR